MRSTSILTAGLLGSALLAGPALAMPAMPHSGLVAGNAVERVVEGRHRHLHGTGRTDHEYRAHRRNNTYLHGNPNARNPHQDGHAQQLGETTNGPRY